MNMSDDRAAAVAQVDLSVLTRYASTPEGMEVDTAFGRYYSADEVDALLATKAAQPAAEQVLIGWREFLEMWTYDGALQTFSSREQFRKEAKQLLAAPISTDASTQDQAGAVAWVTDAENWGSALNAASWAFIEACPENSALLFNYCKPALRAAILKYAEKVSAAPALGSAQAAQADVRDAERYRWIRQFGYQAHELIFHDDGTLKWGSDLDEGIDTALRITPADDSQNAVGGAA